MAAEIRIFPCLNDNYGYLIHDPATQSTASIDAPEAAPVIAALEQQGWKLTDILVTHHHGEADHLAYLERPFLEAQAAIHQRMHQLGIAH